MLILFRVSPAFLQFSFKEKLSILLEKRSDIGFTGIFVNWACHYKKSQTKNWVYSNFLGWDKEETENIQFQTFIDHKYKNI